MTDKDTQHKNLENALEVARRAGNPFLAAAIRLALEKLKNEGTKA